MNIYDEKRNCSGCAACYSVCPVHCIEMKYDEEGFYYPYVDGLKCICCDKCKSVCPYLNPGDDRSDYMKVYGIQNIFEEIRMKSTAGGGFSVLADYVLAKGGVVYGAGFDDNMHVIHKGVTKVEQLEELRMSKYTQSDIGNCFTEIKNLLKSNTKVLFVGLPCQVEGLLIFLKGMNTIDLLTADLKCYGVPSPELYDRWITFLTKKYGSLVKHVYFRDKKYGYAGVNVKVVLSNGKVLEDNLDVKSYGKTMFSKLGLRPSCYECVFRKRKKLADFTIGDTWEIGKYAPNMDDNKGTTQLEIHTDKGIEVFKELTNNVICIHMYDMYGKELEEYLKKEERVYDLDINRRVYFFDDMHKLDYGSLMKKHFPVSKKEFINNISKPLIHKFPFSEYVFRILRKAKIKSARSHK